MNNSIRTTPGGAAALQTLPQHASMTVPPKRTARPSRGDAVVSQASSALANVNKAGSGAPSNAASRTLAKMGDFLQGLQTTMLSLSAQSMFRDAVDANKEDSAAVKDIKAKHKDKVHQGKVRLAKLREQIRAKEKAGFFGKLMKKLGVIGAVLTAAATVASGGGALAIIAAGLAIAAAVVNAASDSPAAKWISLGLGVASLGCSIASIFTAGGTAAAQAGTKGAQAASAAGSKAANTAGTTAREVVKNVCRVGQFGVEANKGLAMLGKADADAKAMEAGADREGAAAKRKESQRDIDQLTSEFDERTKRMTKAFNDMLALLKLQHQIEITTAGGQA